jgi:hypothetical protein
MTETIAPAAAQAPAAAAPAAAAPVTPVTPVTPVEPGVVPGAAVTAAAAVAGAVEANTWYEGLPAEKHEALKGYASLDDAMSAMDLGKTVNTAKGVEDYSIDLGEALNGKEDGGALDRYKAHCLERGISPERAQGMIDFQMGELAEAQKVAREMGDAALGKLWGNSKDANTEKAFVALAALDRKMGGRLAPAFAAAGLTDDPLMVEVMHLVSTMIGEDNLGASGPGSGDVNKPVSTEDAYSSLFNKKQ